MVTEHHFTERIIGVGIYATIVIMFYYLMRRENSNNKRLLRIYMLILAFLAYFFIPASVTDLYRLWITADSYNKMSIMTMAKDIFSGWSSPLGLFYVCLISRINKHLLPALTCLVFYTNIFYIINDYADKHNISKTKSLL